MCVTQEHVAVWHTRWSVCAMCRSPVRAARTADGSWEVVCVADAGHGGIISDNSPAALADAISGMESHWLARRLVLCELQAGLGEDFQAALYRAVKERVGRDINDLYGEE